MILYNHTQFWRKLAGYRAWSYITVIDKPTGKPIRAHFESDFRVYTLGIWRQFDSWEAICEAFILPREVCIGGKKFKGNFDCEYFDDVGRPNGDTRWGSWDGYFKFKANFAAG